MCKLNKALYGLKQALQAWFHILKVAFTTYGFQSSRVDPSLFIYHTTTAFIFLLVYVDDILVTGSGPTLIYDILKHLHIAFSIRDLR